MRTRTILANIVVSSIFPLRDCLLNIQSSSISTIDLLKTSVKSLLRLRSQVSTILTPRSTHVHADSEVVVNNNVGYGSSWIQMSIGDDSDDEADLDPRKELNAYLDSKREVRSEGLVEWWGVSVLTHHHDVLLTDRYPRVSTIPLATPPSPTSRETISRSKDPQLPQSARFQVVGSLVLTYATDSKRIRSKHSRSSRVPFGMGLSTSVMK